MYTAYKSFGAPCSLYTAKARSYLRKQRISFEEFSVSDQHYQLYVVPKIGRVIMPVLEAAYLEFLNLFTTHLRNYPYLLGGQPTLGDYALMGP
jgi:glutathione S-transferase